MNSRINSLSKKLAGILIPTAAFAILSFTNCIQITTAQEDEKSARLQQLIDQKIRENKTAEAELLKKWKAEHEAKIAKESDLDADQEEAPSQKPKLSADNAQTAVDKVVIPGTSGNATQAKDGPEAASPNLDPEDNKLYFNFEKITWREVIQWIADEGGLALLYEDLPTGSFSYVDPSGYEHSEALDRINLLMLPEGYTLVRSGKLLAVINLGDARSLQTLDTLARFVKADELKDLPKQDVVKCLLPLGELTVEEAIEELSVLNLMTSPAPFNRTNQLMVTDTVSKIQNVKAIIDSFQPDTLDNGTVMKNFSLKHVEAEDILSVARPHLGLATGEMIGIDVSISADVKGNFIFVTGVEDKVALIEGLVKDLDVPQKSLTSEESDATLETYLVRSGNVELIYNVLQTLLAGEDARVSMDREASSIVALASPKVHYEIKETVEQLEAADEDFEIIPLKHADPYFVISLLDEMLDLPSVLDDPEDVDQDAPKIDADPGNRRLFVRAKRHRIEQIKKIVEGLDTPIETSGDRLRVLPIRGEEAKRILELGARFWNEDNPIRLLPETGKSDFKTERAIHLEDAATPPQDVPVNPNVHQRNAGRPPRLTSLNTPMESHVQQLSDGKGDGKDPINAQITPRGLLLSSDDSEALDKLIANLQILAGPLDATPSPPIVYYLKYVKPADALRLLAELLDGGENAREGEAGTLVNGFVSSSGAYTTSILTTRDGLMTMMAGSITVVADSRLNRLIAQGTSEDIEAIEAYLNIIDKDKGIIDIETYGTSHVVELQYTDANEVADTVRAAFAGRVAAASSPGSTAGQQRGAQPTKEAPAAKGRGEDANEAKGKNAKAGNTKGSSPAPRDLEPKMTIAVHESSNSIIVTAPEQLFAQVEKLIQTIDTNSKQTVEILAPENSALLQAMFGESTEDRTRPANNGGRSSSRTQGNGGGERLQSILRDKFGGR